MILQMQEKQRDKLILGFLKGKLSSGEEKLLYDWINEYPDNKRIFLEQQELFKKRVVEADDPKVIGQWDKLKSRINSMKDSENVGKVYPVSSFRNVVAIAAAFVIGIIITSVVLTSILKIGGLEDNIVEVTAPYGARTNFTLPDGSSVWLNSGSTISYPHKFKKERSVTLLGEAFFDVKKDSKSFIVSTHYGDVEVKGTAFNLKAFANDIFETTLERGFVLVKSKKSKRNVLLKPGMQAVDDQKELKVFQVETELYTSWKDGKLIFRNEYLPDVARKLERWYNIKINIAEDENLSEIWFTGTIEFESISEVLELIKTTSSINYFYNEKTRTITITK